MITEDYVSFEAAKILKEKGFDENCAALYDLRTGEISQQGVGYVFNNSQWENFITAPTLQMVMKWLREVHNIAICICAYYPIDSYELSYRNNKPYWKIRIMNHIFSRDYDSFNTYEEACKVGIKYCLENLI